MAGGAAACPCDVELLGSAPDQTHVAECGGFQADAEGPLEDPQGTRRQQQVPVFRGHQQLVLTLELLAQLLQLVTPNAVGAAEEVLQVGGDLLADLPGLE